MNIPLLFDCDTGVDDAMAIMYGSRNGAKFVACTVTHGNVPVEIGARNTLTVLDQVGLAQVPVYQGAARPLAQPLRTAERVHGEDGLGNTNPVPSTRELAGSLAAVDLVRLASEFPGELTLVPVGPLTNIALALMLDPQFAHNIKRVVLMGGAVMVPGNVNPVAEANTFCDPEAAQLVIDAPWEVTWVGLEATSRTALTPQMIEQLEATSTPHGQFMWRAMQFYIDLYEQSLGHRTCLLHDPLAMALALDPGLATYRAVPAQIELRGSHTRGQVVADLRTTVRQGETNDPGMIRIVDDLNLEKFHQRFLDSFET